MDWAAKKLSPGTPGCFLKAYEENQSVRLAPLFDQGVSLLFSTYGDEKQIENIDVMYDFPVNNYIGSKSLEYNLSLIPDNFDLQINSLSQTDCL